MKQESKDLQVVSGIFKADDVKPLHLSDEDYEKIKPFRALLQFRSIPEVLDYYEKFRPYVARFLNCSLEQAAEFIVDKLKYYRWARQVRLMYRTDELMREIGLTEPKSAIPLNLAIRLLEGASCEENDEIQDLWIKVMINAMNPENTVVIRRVVIEILKNIGPLESQILQAIYAKPYTEIQRQRIVTQDLPQSFSILPADSVIPSEPLPPDVETALANLTLTGCLSPVITPDGLETFNIVTPTRLGSMFIEACTMQGNNE